VKRGKKEEGNRYITGRKKKLGKKRKRKATIAAADRTELIRTKKRRSKCRGTRKTNRGRKRTTAAGSQRGPQVF